MDNLQPGVPQRPLGVSRSTNHGSRGDTGSILSTEAPRDDGALGSLGGLGPVAP